MALTPEDVVNKRFQSTKFREGYDQDEVDDFLDEVVVELRRLTAENDELKAHLAAGGDTSAVEGGAPVSAPATVVAPVVAEPTPEPVAAAPIAATPAPAVEVADETAGTTNLLQLARRLHEEHVKEGAEKRDALVAEGHATAARVVAEAEAKQRAQINALDQERGALEKKIDELRTFERDYRQKLKSYIEGQLSELNSAFPVDGAAGAGTAPKPSFQGFGA